MNSCICQSGRTILLSHSTTTALRAQLRWSAAQTVSKSDWQRSECRSRSTKICLEHAATLPKNTTSHDKQLLLDILEASTTSRDAKSYLLNFSQSQIKPPIVDVGNQTRDDLGVNLGSLYVDAGPLQRRDQLRSPISSAGHRKTHIALVKLQHADLINEHTLGGVCQTIAQLAKLGLTSIVIYTITKTNDVFSSDTQAERIIDSLKANGGSRGQKICDISHIGASAGRVSESQRLVLRNLDNLFSPLRRGVIALIPSFGILEGVNRIQALSSDELAISISQSIQTYGHAQSFSIDRVIVLDEVGGIPASDRMSGSHVYINLEQEYHAISDELRGRRHNFQGVPNAEIHLANLNLLNQTLRSLPSTSSGIIATPMEVAESTQRRTEKEDSLGVKTRRRRNPLIHNLLTDKPAVSSSLPFGRSPGNSLIQRQSTFVKRGLPLQIISGTTQMFGTVVANNQGFLIMDKRLDMPRLYALIEKSFGRQLDLPNYIKRVSDKLATVIVVGDYEGCALITWETPLGQLGKRVPYLDKFAVLPRSQGSGTSVADLLFNAMVKDCFPEGICWRSRADNPVNKWYFERAAGTMTLKGSHWTCFWTTVDPQPEQLVAYESICRTIESSWQE